MTLATDVRNRIKAISTRKDVRVETRRLGRGLKKQWLLDYARDEHKLPDEIIDFYAEFDGFEFAWQSNGLIDDPRGRARGVVRMSKLDDLMWREREGFELMPLDNVYNGDRGVFLVRQGGEIRAGFATQGVKNLENVRWFDSFTHLLTDMCDRGFLPYELGDIDVVDAVREKLSQPPPKVRSKLVAGTRVFGAKIKTSDFGLPRRGTVRELVKGSNGKTYADIDWDWGDRSFTRQNLLATVAPDAYEQIRTQDLREVDPEVLRQLLDQFGYNVASAMYVDRDPDKPVRFSCQSIYWLADVSRATPLAGYREWVGQQVTAIEGQPDPNRAGNVEAQSPYVGADSTIPMTGRFGGSEFSMFHSDVDLHRLARSMVESVVLRWLRTPKEDAYAKVVALVKRMKFERKDNPISSFIRKVDPKKPPSLCPVPLWADSETKAKSLGLVGGPVYYTHD